MNPTVTTSRDLIRRVAERWKNQYFKEGKWGYTYSGSTESRYHRLLELDVETCSTKDVEDILGAGGGWVRMNCDQCGEFVDKIVTVGEEIDYESATANLCAACVELAARAIGGR